MMCVGSSGNSRQATVAAEPRQSSADPRHCQILGGHSFTIWVLARFGRLGAKSGLGTE